MHAYFKEYNWYNLFKVVILLLNRAFYTIYRIISVLKSKLYHEITLISLAFIRQVRLHKSSLSI